MRKDHFLMRKSISRLVLVALLVFVAVPASASAHGYFAQWGGQMSNNTHNLTVNEAKAYCQFVIPGSYHGGVNYFGNVLAFHDGWPYFQEHTIGYRANDGSLMKCKLRETFMVPPGSRYDLTASHQ